MSEFSTDILIVGGGIAGLWLNAQLRAAGYHSMLLEQTALGSGQSIKSQGIIHGGTKYALHGLLTGSSEAIADMPKRWRTALNGQGELDLRGVRVLSEAHYLWSPGTLAGNLTSFFASKAMRGRVDSVSGTELPPALQHPDFHGRVYRLDELVLDVPSLIERLQQLAEGSCFRAQQIQLLENSQGQVCGAQADGQRILAQRVVLCAGAGNAALLAGIGRSEPAMQVRPLHMVMLTAPSLKPLYAHCLGASPKPRITITSHPMANGQWAWYLGGELAEAAGVARTEQAQIQHARSELEALLPWVSLSEARWACLRVDRAEPAQSGGVRPENAFVAQQDNLMIAWPTKLALAPDLSDRIVRILQDEPLQPSEHPAQTLPLEALSVAKPAWEVLQ